MARQGQLDQNPVRIVLLVQFQNPVNERAGIALLRETKGRRTYPDLVASLSLVANIEFRSRVVSDHADGEAWRQSEFGLQPFDAPAALLPDVARNNYSVDNLGCQRDPPSP